MDFYRIVYVLSFYPLHYRVRDFYFQLNLQTQLGDNQSFNTIYYILKDYRQSPRLVPTYKVVQNRIYAVENSGSLRCKYCLKQQYHIMMFRQISHKANTGPTYLYSIPLWINRLQFVQHLAIPQVRSDVAAWYSLPRGEHALRPVRSANLRSLP